MPSHASRRRRESSVQREAAPLPVPLPAPKPTPALASQPSWGPFRISGGAGSPASCNASNSHAALPELVPVMPCGSLYNATITMASDTAGGREGGAGCWSRGGGRVIPPCASTGRAPLGAGEKLAMPDCDWSLFAPTGRFPISLYPFPSPRAFSRSTADDMNTLTHEKRRK